MNSFAASILKARAIFTMLSKPTFLLPRSMSEIYVVESEDISASFSWLQFFFSRNSRTRFPKRVREFVVRRGGPEPENSYLRSCRSWSEHHCGTSREGIMNGGCPRFVVGTWVLGLTFLSAGSSPKPREAGGPLQAWLIRPRHELSVTYKLLFQAPSFQ